ncbi:MAG: (d)CMP kinase [Oscillospiraceae bacterium]|nr:(d)CMP kinase [Oscillospiraceae bacterium]
MKRDKISIAIDGPAGAGKSAVSAELAKFFRFIHFDTGALYRVLGYFFLINKLDFKDESIVCKNLESSRIRFKLQDGIQRMFLGKNEVTNEIRSDQVSFAASIVSSFVCSRNFLLKTQRDIAKNNDVIMDGRDIGTVVLPNANIKIFLTASPEVRAKRRFEDLRSKGFETDYETVFSSIINRDKNDSTRAVAPLVPAEDSIIYDTTNVIFEEVFKNLSDKIVSKLKLES